MRKGYIAIQRQLKKLAGAAKMKISARNRFPGTVESVEEGVITSKVKIRVDAPVVITAVITKEAVGDLKLKRGDRVEAIIKSTEVLVGKE